MTFINWADPHEMLGLLSDYVADERLEAAEDPSRARFLTGVLDALGGFTEETSEADLAAMLGSILEGTDREFRHDPVLVHLEACIEELDRIRLGSEPRA